ncbi:MAG TPA: hypothetical protein VNQ56_16210 [Pseudolabrys sp.]|nr:hypothetical protein [Pseudolabrys sp.]
MSQTEQKWLVFCSFIAAVIWYASAFWAIALEAIPHNTLPPADLFSQYRSAFYIEFQEKTFVVSLVLLSVLSGLVLRRHAHYQPRQVRTLALGTMIAILFIPLQMAGAFGIAIAANWPAIAPPVFLPGGWLWSLPGTTALVLTSYAVFFQRQ